MTNYLSNYSLVDSLRVDHRLRIIKMSVKNDPGLLISHANPIPLPTA